jgi:PAS domain S-box-containing protein
MPSNASTSNLDDLEWIRKSKKLLDALNIGFLLQDMDDNILEVNKALLKINGMTREELVGHHASEFYNEKEYKRLRTDDLFKIDSEYYQSEYFIYHKSGKKIPVLFIVSINKDASGRPISENVLLLDISKQKQIQAKLKATNKELTEVNEALKKNQESLKNEKMKLEAILFGIGDSVSVFDINGNHLLSNLQARHIYKKQNSLLPLKACKDEIVTLNDGNKQRHFEAKVEEVKDSHGQTFAYVEILKDMTDQIALKSREQELQFIRRQIKLKKVTSEIITKSPAMHKCIDAALLCAELESTVLITGETGVGKNMIAAAIHAHSDRNDKPFVQVNCGALPENLIESELFGHVRGSFSGAISDSMGLFRTADGGTLFLDEVGDIGFSLQVKLLHAIQDKEIRPIGSSKTYKVDVRLLCATNKNMKNLVVKGLFRQDLYYRLAVIPLMIPPLRERTEDILILANHFINKHSKKSKQRKIKFHHETQKILLKYWWPGNVRELENVIEYALTMSTESLILPEHLPVYLLPQQGDSQTSRLSENILSDVIPPNDSFDSLAESEKESILNALWRCKFNQTRAAQELGISRVTLWRKLSKYTDI